MKTISITPATTSQVRLRGIALASVIIALMLSLLLEALDQAIVGTAMPRIIAELHGLDRCFITSRSDTLWQSREAPPKVVARSRAVRLAFDQWPMC